MTWSMNDNWMMVLVVLLGCATCAVNTALESQTQRACLEQGHEPERCREMK